MKKKQYFISLIENSNFSDPDKSELIQIIKKSKGDSLDPLVKTIIHKIKVAKDVIDLFYENPADFYEDINWIPELLDKLQNL